MSGAAMPKTERGRRAREAFLEAGRAIFEEHGYFATKVSQIIARSGLSTGTFYRYFDTKEKLLGELIFVVRDDLYQSARRGWSSDDARGSLYAITKGYFEAYRDNAPILLAIHDYIRVSPEANAAWQQAGSQIWERIEGYVARALKESGDEQLDPHLTSVALSAMVAALAQQLFIEGTGAERQTSVDEAARVVAEIWYRAVFQQLDNSAR